MKPDREALYRRVNTRTHGVQHDTGGEYRWSRNRRRVDDSARGAMHGRKWRGLDYTPLFRFLLSRVGEDWTDVHREAVARLDREEPIFWLVARSEEERQAVVRAGVSSFYSGLHVDGDGRLAVVDPTIRLEDVEPSCSCCTHTFNGRRLVRAFRPDSSTDRAAGRRRERLGRDVPTRWA